MMAYSVLNLKRIADSLSVGLYTSTAGFAAGGIFEPWLLVPLALTLPLAGRDIYNRLQRERAVRRNFGLLGDARYVLESLGPEMHQYFVETATNGRPFTRGQRGYVYRLSHGGDEGSPFGSLDDLVGKPTIAHSMYPRTEKEIERFSLTFGDTRDCPRPYTITKHVMISGMSYGALGRNAVRAFARGARLAQIPISTGEGGWPKYHLMEGADIIFQMGTAKFGVQNPDHTLNEHRLRRLCELDQVKMIEIKLSQGAKPGKGGLLPGAKVTEEVAGIRNIAPGVDCVSPPRQVECYDAQSTVQFIGRVQDISERPTGIKLCVGQESEFIDLVREMKRKNIFPDYIAIDGAEGGTGAAPQTFLDYVGVPINDALRIVTRTLEREGVRKRTKIIAAGKLVDAGSQFQAMARGADAVYSARGIMFAGGCIQALECDKNICPVGITTHNESLQRGLDIEEKSLRVANYIAGLDKAVHYLLAASGRKSFREVGSDVLYVPENALLPRQQT